MGDSYDGGCRSRKARAEGEEVEDMKSRMPASRLIPIVHRLLGVAALLALLPLAGAATTDLGAPGGSLRGQLLIAAPEMDDPRFVHAVILMVQHDQSGALGIVINRPVGEMSYADLLKAIGTSGNPVAGKVR